MRATDVYAILAHVAAEATSDGNKMKARLTCVCCNSCPLRVCEKWRGNQKKCDTITVQSYWCRSLGWQQAEWDDAARAVFTEMGSCASLQLFSVRRKKTQFCGIGDTEANKVPNRPGWSRKQMSVSKYSFHWVTSHKKVKGSSGRFQRLAKNIDNAWLQSNEKRNRIILHASR